MHKKTGTFLDSVMYVHEMKEGLKHSSFWRIIGMLFIQMAFVGSMHAQQQPEKIKLASEINSRYEEVKPLISNGKMYFVRTLHPGNNAIQSVWVSKYAKSKWSRPTLLDTNINMSNRFNAICKVSNDEQVFYLNNATSDRKSWNAGITKAIKTGRSWVYEKFYECPFKSSGFVDFWISDEDDLIFFSAIKSKSSKEDIFMVKRDSTGWKEPKILEVFNSKFVDAAPFFDVENRTLFITSNRNGNYNIYGSQATDSSFNTWSTLTYSDFNTDLFEGYYHVGDWGGVYFVSQSSAEHQLDIFQYTTPDWKPNEENKKIQIVPELAHLIIKVQSKTSKQPLDAQVIFKTPSEEKTNKTNKGQTDFALPKDSKVKVEVSQNGFYPQSFEIPMTKMELIKDVALDPIEIGQTIILHNIFFDSDKSFLKPESYPEIELLASFMASHPGVKIKITGHTDDQGDDAYNLRLSQDRIESVLDYLIYKGVDKIKVVGEGMGEKQPIATNSTDEGRAQNRRVEFTVLEK